MAVSAGSAIKRADIINLFTSTVLNTIKANAYHKGNPPMEGQYQCVPSTMMDDISNLPTPEIGIVGQKISASTLANAIINTTKNLTRVGTFSYVRYLHESHIAESTHDSNGYTKGQVIYDRYILKATKSGKVVFTNNYVRNIGYKTSTTNFTTTPESYFTIDATTGFITPVKDSCFSLTKIIIPETVGNYRVMGIADSAFQGYTNLQSIIMPDTVYSIGYRAFYGCTALTSITLSPNTTTIGNNAFYNCTALTSAILGNKLKTIGTYVFYYCTALNTITIPNTITSIGVRSFYNTSSLTTVNYTGTETQWNAISKGSYNYYITRTTVTKVYNYTIPSSVYPSYDSTTTVTSTGSAVSHSIKVGSVISATNITQLLSACLTAWNNTSKYNYEYTNEMCHTVCHNNCYRDCHDDCHDDCYSD